MPPQVNVIDLPCFFARFYPGFFTQMWASLNSDARNVIASLTDINKLSLFHFTNRYGTETERMSNFKLVWDSCRETVAPTEGFSIAFDILNYCPNNFKVFWQGLNENARTIIANLGEKDSSGFTPVHLSANKYKLALFLLLPYASKETLSTKPAESHTPETLFLLNGSSATSEQKITLEFFLLNAVAVFNLDRVLFHYNMWLDLGYSRIPLPDFRVEQFVNALRAETEISGKSKFLTKLSKKIGLSHASWGEKLFILFQQYVASTKKENDIGHHASQLMIFLTRLTPNTSDAEIQQEFGKIISSRENSHSRFNPLWAANTSRLISNDRIAQENILFKKIDALLFSHDMPQKNSVTENPLFKPPLPLSSPQ